MEWSIEWDDAGFLRVATRGVFTPGGYERLVLAIVSHSAWRPGLPALLDHRALDLGETTLETVQSAGLIHVRYEDRIGDGRAAILMRSPADFGSARQYQSLVEQDTSSKLRIFLDVDEAEAWVRPSRDGA